MTYDRNTISQIPTCPGVYQFFDTDGVVIYVGKAVQLKKRVQSYFSKTHQDIKTTVMVQYICSIEVIETHSEKEALLLENQLIKSLRPKYNILLKDDKTYPYIKLTLSDPFPRVIVTRHKQQDGAKYFGPYPSFGSTRALRRLLYELFPIRPCKQTITLTELQPKCMLLDIGKCIGPCIKKEVKPDYDQLIKQMMDLLAGKNKQLTRQLEHEMAVYSSQLQYEKAAVIRDKLQKLFHLTQRQTVCLNSLDTFWVWVFQSNDRHDYVLVQEIVNGKLLRQNGYFQSKSASVYSSFLEQCFLAFSQLSRRIPDYIVCRDTMASSLYHLMTMMPWETKKSAEKWVVSPQKGEKRQVLLQAESHANQALMRLISGSGNAHQAMMTLQEGLSLPKLPKVILGIDISHLQGRDIVGACVCFRDGMPSKMEYRRYAIRCVSGMSHDPASIQEVVTRRLEDCLSQKWVPDLVLIDGGKPQLNFAYAALKSLDLHTSVDMVALAKKKEEVFVIGQSHGIQLSRSHEGLKLLQRVRDESHRFALQFQRKRRHQSALKSRFQDIPGIGPKRLSQLHSVFESIDEIRSCSVDDIAKRTGFSLTIARKIADYVKKSR